MDVTEEHDVGVDHFNEVLGGAGILWHFVAQGAAGKTDLTVGQDFRDFFGSVGVFHAKVSFQLRRIYNYLGSFFNDFRIVFIPRSIPKSLKLATPERFFLDTLR